MEITLKKLAPLSLGLLLSACASGLDYKVLDTHMTGNNCQGALDYVKGEKGTYGENMRLNYLLDMGMVNLQCKNYDKSNGYFHRAEDLSDQLWTKSISREVASLVTNDYALPYGGEDFERAGINLFSAMNYAVQGNFEEALVECRRLDSQLTLYNDKYENKNVYKEDAFARYLSGMIYEAEGELDDAYIDYYKAYKVYHDYERNYGTSIPSALVNDLLRLAGATGRGDDLSSEFNDLDGKPSLEYKKAKKLAKVVLIHLNGKSPVKNSNTITVPSFQGPLSIAFPTYKINRPACSNSQLIVKSTAGTETVGTELVQDINEIALKNLDDRKVRVIAKTVARAAVKQAASDNLIQNDQAKALFNVFNTLVLEKADTRTWRTLPGEIYMTMHFLEEGDYSLSASNCGNDRPLQELSLKSGDTKFLIFDTIF